MSDTLGQSSSLTPPLITLADGPDETSSMTHPLSALGDTRRGTSSVTPPLVAVVDTPAEITSTRTEPSRGEGGHQTRGQKRGEKRSDERGRRSDSLRTYKIMSDKSRSDKGTSGQEKRGRGRRRRALGEVSELPPSLISGAQESLFMAQSLDVWEDAPACKGVRPGPDLSPSRLILGRNYTSKEIVQGAKGNLPMRAVIWSARSGMGNSFQGLIATFIYALLSGRQIVASLGGLYGATFETVGRGFHFGLDWTEPQVPRVPLIPFDREFPIVEAVPVVQANPRDFHDSFWVKNARLTGCVMQAMSCQDMWCVRSKIVNIVLGKPKVALGRAIWKTLNFQPCTFLGQKSKTAAGLEGKGAGGRRLLDSTAHMQLAAGSRSESACEGTPRDEGGAIQASRGGTGMEGRRLGEVGRGATQEDSGAGAGVPGRAVLRQRRRLGQDEKDGQDALKLKFDVAIHVRTVSTCSEGYINEPACKDRGLEGILGTLDFLPKLHQSLMHQRWACISSLLAFLLKLKRQRQSEGQGISAGGGAGGVQEPFKSLFSNPGDGDLLKEFVNASLLRKAELPLTEEQLSSTADWFSPTPLPANLTTRLIERKLWRIEHSQFLALDARNATSEEAGSSAGSGEGDGLSILLATDSEALRPLLVEYLRPFGTVTFSAAHIMHLGLKGAGDDTERLGNLAEFYLMSRSALILSYKRSKSSYARTAGYYGNSTLLYGMEQKTCDFPLEHIAEVMGSL